MESSSDERGAAAYDFARVGVEVEPMIDQDLEYGDGLGGAGCEVEIVVYRGIWEAEALGEAPGEDIWVCGFDGLEGDGVQDWGAGGRVGKCDFMRGRLFSWVRVMRSWVKGSEGAMVRRGWAAGRLAGRSPISWSGCEIVR